MAVESGAVDLVCGPDGPLPEGRRRYQLLGRLGAGGQADVFRGVRLSGRVSSSPVTVKVFRAASAGTGRSLLDQMRSWDKGDAVLMDLNTRGVPGICLRVDGFYGAPPAPPDSTATVGGSDQRIPYQVLDYLPGHTLLQHVVATANGGPLPRLNGAAALDALARTVNLLHNPAEPNESPVVHMDVKPSNVLVLPSGEVRLIDFTAARYQDPLHITTIAHTPESGGPEAFTGKVGPSYDVHGFGAVAYYLVTGWLPRGDRATPRAGVVTAPGALRRHPLLDADPRLAAHLLAPLADRPEDRPRSDELVGWVATLAGLAARAANRYVDWGDPAATKVAPRGNGSAPAATRVAPVPISPPVSPVSSAPARVSGVAKVRPPAPRREDVDSDVHGDVHGDGDGWDGRRRREQPARAGRGSGYAPAGYPPVYPPQYPPPPQGAYPPYPGGYPPAGGQPFPSIRRRGRGITAFATVVAVVCWLLWLGTIVVTETPDFGQPVVALALVAGGAVAAYWLTRLAGHLLRTTLDRGPRRGTLVPHLLTAVYLVLCGTVFFGLARANFGAVTAWFSDLWPF